MSADAALMILGGHTDSQICTALQGRPAVRVRLQRILRWGPPPSQQQSQQPAQQGTRQQSNASAQQVPWPDGSKPAMSDPISSQAQFGGAPVQQAQQAPQHWGQQSNSSSRNWYDVTEQEQQAQQAPQRETYYDWDTGATRHEMPSQQAPEANKSKGKHANAQQQTQQPQQSQQPSWSNSWQQGSGKGKSWDQFSSNADWTNYPAQHQAAQAQDTAPSPPIALQPSLQIPQSDLPWSGDRPYHQNPRTGEWLCALACANTFRAACACNFKPKGRIVDHRHSPRSCSHCLAKGTGK